jgi:phosphatidylglycerol lysyltransferase
VHAFKARLRPDGWEPVFLAVPRGAWTWLALLDALWAFARGSPLTFGLRTFSRGPPFVVWGPILALFAWIRLLALAAPARWFPAPWVQGAWVAFDVLLGGLLVALASRYRARLAGLVLALVATDACLTVVEAAVWNLPRLENVGEAAAIGVACAGPVLATLALSGMIRGRALIASRWVPREAG